MKRSVNVDIFVNRSGEINVAVKNINIEVSKCSFMLNFGPERNIGMLVVEII